MQVTKDLKEGDHHTKKNIKIRMMEEIKALTI